MIREQFWRGNAALTLIVAPQMIGNNCVACIVWSIEP